MTEREQKELSMDEILASIRSILQEDNTDTSENKTNEEEEIFDLSTKMIVGNTDNVDAEDIIPLPIEDDISVEQLVRELEAEAGIFEADTKPEAEFIPEFEHVTCQEIEEEQFSEPDIETDFYFEPEQEVDSESLVEPYTEPEQDIVSNSVVETNLSTEDVCGELLGSFAKLFEEQKKSVGIPSSFDADKLVEQIVRETVENKIVPILDSWLKINLPKIIEKEVERVTVKADKY